MGAGGGTCPGGAEEAAAPGSGLALGPPQSQQPLGSCLSSLNARNRALDKSLPSISLSFLTCKL